MCPMYVLVYYFPKCAVVGLLNVLYMMMVKELVRITASSVYHSLCRTIMECRPQQTTKNSLKKINVSLV